MAEFAAGDRLSDHYPRSVDELIVKILKYFPQADTALIERAYQFSEDAHSGQIRRSGEAYISHPLSVTAILADLHLDLDSLATGLLHDTIEDTGATIDDVRRLFGDTIASLVDGVTKISKINFKTSTEQQGENIRKMIVAMGKDVRVILVKLADRLHNMRTLNHMPYEKQSRIALETLEIYCPLASRLGISSLKIELEDLAFRFYRPDVYYELNQLVDERQKDQSRYIDEVKKLLGRELEVAQFKNFKIQGRSKHLWSIYRKMSARNIGFEQVNDLLAFRVVVDTLGQCYEVLGHIHSLWKPIPGRFKDFIAMPKANNYQSLHTTVIGPGGERIEIQIRTESMHLIAERGIAAHWQYKERGKIDTDTVKKFDWLKELVSVHQQTGSPEEFLDTIKTDLFEGEIYVFTPKGDVREFPEGATPIDFAYAVHTGVGNKCIGARVNGKMVPLRYQLQNGDTVEIMTSNTQHPSKDWLKLCVTSRAKSKIRAFVKDEQRLNALNLGKDLVDREFRKHGLSYAKYFDKPDRIEGFLKSFGIHSGEEIFIRVGYGKLEPRVVFERVVPEHITVAGKEVKEKEAGFLQKAIRSVVQKTKKSGSLITVGGLDHVMVYYAKCCSPIPGDPILGFISRGRGVIVHRSDCKKAFDLDSERRVDVEWNAPDSNKLQADRTVRVQIIAQDGPGLLKLFSEAFSSQGMNILGAQIRTTRDQKAICTFEAQVHNVKQLSQTILALQKVKGVIGVSRVTA